MGAGNSALQEAARQQVRAAELEKAAREARAAEERYRAAASTEARTAAVLAPLSAVGYHMLHDRRWPGTRRANVDLVLIGPGGVFIIDTKAWAEVAISGGRIWRGQEDVTDSLENLESLLRVTQSDLAEVGLAPGEVHLLMVLAGKGGLEARIGAVTVVGERDVRSVVARFGQRLNQSHTDAVLSRAMGLFQEMPAAVLESDNALPAQVLATPELFRTEQISLEFEESLRSMPVEEWMTFLSSSQAKLVQRSYNGPSRIRGGAGTGKTVVGLHRAAYLARTLGGKVLFTTYVRTLPAVMRNLLARFAPDVVDQVDFVGFHQFATDVLKMRGINYRLDESIRRRCFNQAWARVARGGVLANYKVGLRYWEDEIDRVIKGRGISNFDEYAALSRTGRQMQLPPQGRKAVWALYEEYNALLADKEIVDFSDLITMAARELDRRPLDNPYRAVIADEAQDLSCVMVRMLHSLVGDAPDGLTLIGDGQQTIYPGGFTLAEAGVNIAGRANILDTNYRNTKQIVSFAGRAVVGDEVSDIEGFIGRCDVAAEIVRTGPSPVVVEVGNHSERFTALVEQVQRLSSAGCRISDLGVLCATKKAVRQSASVLREAGFSVKDLESYDGRPTAALKVGTVKRAKGLEFVHVLLPEVHGVHLAGMQAPNDPAERERWDLERRELYVAMTRARDSLWLAVDNPG